MSPARTYSLLTLLAIGLAACSSTPITPAPTPGKVPVAAAPVPATTSGPAMAATKPMPASTVATVTLPAYLDPKSSLSSQRSVYFDFDVFTIRAEDTGLIERHGKYLASHPAVVIKIEGSADERGSAEYNLALGQRRAESVLRALRIHGARDGQMEAVSWGESKPRAIGEDEASWAQNRRADLQYPKQ